MLRFNKDGKFKIMQITDVHGVPNLSTDTLNLIESALDTEKPDLVIFTGDQIKGYSLKFRNHPERVNECIDKIISPISKRNIPFMVTYGNHDDECTMTNKEQFEIYKRYPTFVQGKLKDDNDVGTASVQIVSSKNDKTIFNIYIIDSHGRAENGSGYVPVYEEQIKWYESERERLKSENGDYIPSLVFQHIPVPEFCDVLKYVEKKTEDAVLVYGGKHDGEYVLLRDKAKENGGFMGEYPAVPDINTEEFKSISSKGDVLGIFVGHDHSNSFVESSNGVDLGYTQSCGFDAYGPGADRGVRLFILDEEKPKEYKTYTKTFKDLVGTRIKTPFREFIYKHVPTSPKAKKSFIIKALIVFGVIVAAILGYKFLTGFNL